MASLIYLGGMYPEQTGVLTYEWIEKTTDYDAPWIAIIAKGNIIEGVEAKT